jgi:DNA-binding XRE family transcriptional regulator
MNGGTIMKIDDLLKKEMQNPEFAKEYNNAKEKSASALALYYAREQVGLTQADLADRAGVPQATIARIERGDNVTFDKLAELAHAMGKTVKVEFV